MEDSQNKLDVVASVLDRLQKAEAEKNRVQMELAYLQNSINQILQRPVIATMTDEQCEKMSKAIAMYLNDIVQQMINKVTKPLLN